MIDAVIVPNAGFTSLKFGAHGVDVTKTLPLLSRGQIESMRGHPHLVVKDKNGKRSNVQAWGEGQAINQHDGRAARDHLVAIQDRRHQGRGGTR
jgi:hypothetical protein